MGRIPRTPLHPDAVARHERRAKVLQLRIAGRGLRDIAKEVGVSHECVRLDLAAMLDASTPSEEDRNRLRALENARLDRLTEFAEQLLLRGMVHVQSHGAQETFEVWHQGVNVGGKLSEKHVHLVLSAMDRLERLSNQRAKLNGLDRFDDDQLPSYSETGEVESPLAGMQAIFSSPDLVARVIELRREARRPVIDAESRAAVSR